MLSESGFTGLKDFQDLYSAYETPDPPKKFSLSVDFLFFIVTVNKYSKYLITVITLR